MNQRHYLKGSVLACTQGNNQSFIRRFTINKKISSNGASVVCYEASHETSGMGVLKEFYPQDAFSVISLERRKDGQLVCNDSLGEGKERFEKAVLEYTEPYELLLEAKKQDKDNVLASFIPPFEIYRGCDENGQVAGTVYIWTPEPELITFDKICEDIQKNPLDKPEHKLVTVLNAVDSLTKCIRALHDEGILHRDIKPSNFGFTKRGKDTLTQALSMFDINSVCSVFNVPEEIVGTEGYMEPEATYDAANNQTDIYSIGATLFHAIVLTKETKENKYTYSDEFFDNIPSLVDNSSLICASEANSHPRLKSILVKILKKSLCEREERYENCEELIEDLEDALYYALPSDIASKKRTGEQWVLADVEKAFDVNTEKNSTLAMQYHLYENPLYRHSLSTSINVLVVGFGNYGQKFTDLCLQTGQMRGKTLNVTIVSEDATDKSLYLESRPELCNFFNIDNSSEAVKDSYGNIDFKLCKLEVASKKKNASVIQDIMCECADGNFKNKPNYVFVALGDDELNYSAATACKEAAEVLDIPLCVSYVQEKNHAERKPTEDFYPVYVNNDVRNSSLYPEIERMALNAHLVWEKDLNISFSNVRKSFRKKYNHDSCVANVLSLKYKLYSVGIDMDEVDFKQAAKKFVQTGLVSDKKGNEIKNQLIWVEHKRWVVEKLCCGWGNIKNLEDCASGATKDEKNKRHVCIVRSNPEQKLSGEFKLNDWDNPSADLSKLDELERMSVRLHRMYVKRAKIVREQNLLNGSVISGIRNLIDSNKKAMTSFGEWYTCLKDISNGEREKVGLYENLKNTFLESVKALPVEYRNALREQVKAFEAMFYPIIASTRYRNYKQDDVAFIENIPFILTYTDSSYLAIPYDTADSDVTRLFSNVASATLVNPSRIIYLCRLEKPSDMEEIFETLPYITSYMDKKNLRASLDFYISYSDKAKSCATAENEKQLRIHAKGKLGAVVFRNVPLSEVSFDISQYISKRSKGKKVFATEINDSYLSNILLGAGFYGNTPCYKFNSEFMRFEDVSGCEELTYIRKKPFITVSDMMSFSLSTGDSTNHPEFFSDYKALWTKYRENSFVWKSLCDTLSDYSKKKDILATFERKREKSNEETEHRFILPFLCHKAAGKIVDFLKQNNVAENGSCVNGLTTDSCEVIIKDRYGYKKEYNRLFANVYPLMVGDGIDLWKNYDIFVGFDNLVVEKLQIAGNRANELLSLLEYFSNKKYIINYEKGQGDYVSFTYATRQIKSLLTTAGKMLEVYTYHKIKEMGRVDDVVTSYEISWEDDSVKNEFDCVVTKGFKSLFIECKARSSIDQDFYFKISSLARQFGINATAVLIADTQEKNSSDVVPANTMQRKRGNMMNVVTIYKQDQINNIGNTLLSILNGNYTPDA